MSAKTKGTGRGYYMISAVASKYNIHPQTLRLYEREGLIKPSRTEGNTRLYSDEDLKELETILALTRHLGVNLAGVVVKDIVSIRISRSCATPRRTSASVTGPVPGPSSMTGPGIRGST